MRKGAYTEKRVRKVRFNESVAQCVLVEGGVRVLSDTRLHEDEPVIGFGPRRRRWEYNRVVTAEDIEAFLPVETQQVVNGLIVGGNEVVDVPGETLVLLEDTTNYVLSADSLSKTVASQHNSDGESSDNDTSSRHKSLYNPTFIFESDEEDSDTETEEDDKDNNDRSSKALYNEEREARKIRLYRHTSDDSTRVNSIAPSPQLSHSPIFEHTDK
ncbi:hypothetical protein RNJ44_02042 [Nakaseomyces bracarensis]|uniref:Uncharacterized protein n=1 Tax=Nakaseomyces bracarensis TaxID=273131 RepID=A0ABR4NMI3_9SACH